MIVNISLYLVRKQRICGTRNRTSSFSVLYGLCVPRSAVAANLPHLPGSLSQTSFVPPAHNQGVSLAPFQGLCPLDNIPADYWLILCNIDY
jgi:hypothetical protein